jgi:hypothetical protein
LGAFGTFALCAGAYSADRCAAMASTNRIT